MLHQIELVPLAQLYTLRHRTHSLHFKLTKNVVLSSMSLLSLIRSSVLISPRSLFPLWNEFAAFLPFTTFTWFTALSRLQKSMRHKYVSKKLFRRREIYQTSIRFEQERTLSSDGSSSQSHDGLDGLDGLDGEEHNVLQSQLLSHFLRLRNLRDLPNIFFCNNNRMQKMF